MAPQQPETHSFTPCILLHFQVLSLQSLWVDRSKTISKHLGEIVPLGFRILPKITSGL